MSSSKILRGDASKAAASMPWAGPSRPAAQPAAPRRNLLPHEQADMDEQLRRAMEAGFEQGRKSAEERVRAELQVGVERLGRAIADLAGYRDRLRRDAERDVVMLSLEIARRILHREISADPEALRGLVKTAIEKMDARDLNRVRIHPDYAAPVEAVLKAIGSPQRIEVVPDRTLEVGGVVFETSRGSYDASVTTQLAEIEKGFAEIVQRRR